MFVCRDGTGAAFVHRDDTGAPLVLRDDIGAVFVCREGIGAAFGTSLADRPRGAGGAGAAEAVRDVSVASMVPGQGRWRCPGLLPAGRSLAACSRPLLPGKPTSCDRAKQEIILSAQITALCVGTALRNGWGDTDGVNRGLKAQLPEGRRSRLQRWCWDGGIRDSPWVKPAPIPPAPQGCGEGLNG